MTTGPEPGERRLTRPPSDRYHEADPETPPAPTGSLARALVWGALAAAAGVALTIVLGGFLALSAGLLVVAGAAGHGVGLASRVGGGATVTGRTRTVLAVGLALAGFAVGQLGLWWYAGTEGGVLPPVDYLAQVFGILVPLQAILAAGFAWWAAR